MVKEEMQFPMLTKFAQDTSALNSAARTSFFSKLSSKFSKRYDGTETLVCFPRDTRAALIPTQHIN